MHIHMLCRFFFAASMMEHFVSCGRTFLLFFDKFVTSSTVEEGQKKIGAG